jgi:transcriptional regulator with XRE-family HTH domain
MPESVNIIFGRNLRILCEERGTFADAARVLDVTRVQLNRYFKGESFPKPNQLARICQLFEVDARILLEPVEILRSKIAPTASSQTFRSSVVPGIERYTQMPVPLPAGIHLMHRRSFTLPGRFLSNLIKVRPTALGVGVRGFDAPRLGQRRRDAGPFAGRSFRGLVLATPDGFVINFYGTGEVPFLTTASVLSNGYFASTGHFRGTYELYRPPLKGELRRVPLIIEVLRQTPGIVLDAARRAGIRDAAGIPHLMLDYLCDLPD